MRIDATRVCKEALQQGPSDRDLGTALVFAANRIYRKRSAEIGLAVLKLIEQYAGRFEKTRLEVLEEFADGRVTIERAATRFPATSSLPLPAEPELAPPRRRTGVRELVAMGYRLLDRAGAQE